VICVNVKHIETNLFKCDEKMNGVHDWVPWTLYWYEGYYVY
jgi:hypothetical protein